MKIKTVQYESSGGKLPLNIVAYAIYANQIIFTGLHSCSEGPVGSTINFAEEIVEAIANEEGISPRNYLFYDLQTHRQYGSHKPGDYTINELKLTHGKGNKPTGVSWTEGYAADYLLRDFAEYIGINPHWDLPRNMAVYAGAIPPL